MNKDTIKQALEAGFVRYDYQNKDGERLAVYDTAAVMEAITALDAPDQPQEQQTPEHLLAPLKELRSVLQRSTASIDTIHELGAQDPLEVAWQIMHDKIMPLLACPECDGKGGFVMGTQYFPDQMMQPPEAIVEACDACDGSGYAATSAAPVQPASKPQIEAWMFQHEETGRIVFVEDWQVKNGFELGNPRLQKIAPLTRCATSKEASEAAQEPAVFDLTNAMYEQIIAAYNKAHPEIDPNITANDIVYEICEMIRESVAQPAPARDTRNQALEEAAKICDKHKGGCSNYAGYCADEIRALQSQPAPEAGKAEDYAYIEACNLAKAIHAQHYREDSPHWRVLPDIRGVISQISNMTVGMTRTKATPSVPAQAVTLTEKGESND